MALISGAATALGVTGLHAGPPARLALVIGNANYSALPPLLSCLASAHIVAAALQKQGFNVIEREDATSGAMDGAIGQWARLLEGQPGATAFAYICSRVVSFNGRAFLLPVSASIEAPSDALAHGVVVATLSDVVRRTAPSSATLALDLSASRAGETSAAPATGTPSLAGLETIGQAREQPAPPGFGYLAVVETGEDEAETPFAATLTSVLSDPAFDPAALVAILRDRLSGGSAHLAAILVPQPAAAPATQKAAPAPTTTQKAAPAPTPALALLPEEEQMSESDKRRVQAALLRLGYYSGSVDGVFGNETRAAIRRYQHEIGSTMSGRLTPAEAGRLVGGS